jgi:hypothetical protein
MTIGQIEDGLLRQLLGVVGARTSSKDYDIIRINDMQVADPPVGDPIDVALNELGKYLVVFAQSDTQRIRGGIIERHASLPLDELHGWGDAVMCGVAELVDWQVVSNEVARLGNEIDRKPTGSRAARTVRDPNRQ